MASATELFALAPSDFLQLAGHPLRWKLLGELARSDRVVSELTETVREPQNLVSYHLGKLRNAGLVFARRSSADRRDSYYGLDLPRFGDLLAATGGALHPGLRMERPETQAVPKRVRVLFLCSGNSARSQMAEALAKARSGGAIEAFSAGSEPKPLHPNAERALREVHGLGLKGHGPKHFDTFSGQRFDRVITLCDRVREVCPDFPGHPEAVHWSISNPATGAADRATYPLFKAVAAELGTRIDFLLAALGGETRARS